MSSMDHLILLPSVLLEHHTPENLIFKSSHLFKLPRHSSKLSGLQFTNHGTFFVCVNNMTDQVNENISRPGSAQSAPIQLKTPSKADQQRLEKIHLLREKQNSERLKKLEELKEHAAAAAKLREEQDTRRRQHFLELSKKDTDRRRAAEERRRFLEEERQTALEAKFESKRMTSSMISTSSKSNERKYAFGSCTPRLIENYDGFLWKSQYNLNLAPPPGAGSSDSNKQGRATSAQDLLAGKRRNMMITSVYEWDQTRTTIDNPLVYKRQSNRDDDGSQNRLYFFCGRRKTDLTPTIPIRRDFQSPRSTTTSGRLSSRSMTRLDKVSNISGPGGNRTPSPGSSLHQRSKSTNQLYKLTRTELLRQEKAKKREGFSSTMSTRPPSSLSSAATPSVMTSSTHSGVNMRSRPSARKPRPVSVHVTGISSNTPMSLATTPTSEDRKGDSNRTLHARKLYDDKLSARKSDAMDRLSTPRPRSSTSRINENSENERSSSKTPDPKKDYSTATIRKATPKPKKSDEKKGGEKTAAATPPPSHVGTENNSKITGSDQTNKAKIQPAPKVITAAKNEPTSNNNNSLIVDSSADANLNSKKTAVLDTNVEITKIENADSVLEDDDDSLSQEKGMSETVNVKKEGDIESSDRDVDGLHISVNEKQEESKSKDTALVEPTTVTVATNGFLPQPQEPQQQLEVKASEEAKEKEGVVKANSISAPPLAPAVSSAAINSVSNQNGDVVATKNHVNAEQNQNLTPQTGAEDTSGEKKLKITNEEQAKAALAEKRRLAREAQEREVARLEELARQEDERQLKEAQDAERLIEETRKAEEERLMKAIKERELREEEERKQKIEDENARLEKEIADKEAAREAERLRLEMEERLKREEEERVERRRRVEAIMSRTRIANKQTQNQENQQENLKNIAQQQEELKDAAPPVIPTTMNDNSFNNIQNNTINNFNNNSTTSTLISFDDNEFNCNNRGQPEDQHQQIDGAFRTSAMEGSTNPASGSAAATIEDLLS